MLSPRNLVCRLRKLDFIGQSSRASAADCVGSKQTHKSIYYNNKHSGRLRQEHQYKNGLGVATWAHKDSYCEGRTNNEQ